MGSEASDGNWEADPTSRVTTVRASATAATAVSATATIATATSPRCASQYRGNAAGDRDITGGFSIRFC